jgi:hypothetical protein
MENRVAPKGQCDEIFSAVWGDAFVYRIWRDGELLKLSLASAFGFDDSGVPDEELSESLDACESDIADTLDILEAEERMNSEEN